MRWTYWTSCLVGALDCVCFGYTHQSPAGALFAVSVVGCLLGYSSCLVVWIPLFLDPSDGVFGRFDLAALCGCRTLNFCLFVMVGLLSSLGLGTWEAWVSDSLQGLGVDWFVEQVGVGLCVDRSVALTLRD